MGQLSFKPNWGIQPLKMAVALYFNRKQHKKLAISIIVPNVVGLTETAAIIAIREAGLTHNITIGTVNPVVSQAPIDGTEVTPFSFIDITLTN